MAFWEQMEDITDVYLEWSYATSAEGRVMPTCPVPVDSGKYSIGVVATFSKIHLFYNLNLPS